MASISILDIYYSLLEHLASKLPLYGIYNFIYYTAPFIRNDLSKNIQLIKQNLSLFYTQKEAEKIIADMLRFSARLVVENTFLGKEENKVKSSFSNRCPKISSPCIVLTGHFFNYWLLIEFLRINKQETVLLMGDYPKKNSPLERSGFRAWQSWQKYQEFIYASNGSPYKACQKIIEENKRLFLLIDVPYPRGQKTSLLGLPIKLPVGGIRLAEKYSLQVHFVFPFARNCLEKYQIFYYSLPKTTNMNIIMNTYISILEKIIKRYPASWLGWLYFQKLASNNPRLSYNPCLNLDKAYSPSLCSNNLSPTTVREQNN